MPSGFKKALQEPEKCKITKASQSEGGVNTPFYSNLEVISPIDTPGGIIDITWNLTTYEGPQENAYAEGSKSAPIKYDTQIDENNLIEYFPRVQNMDNKEKYQI